MFTQHPVFKWSTSPSFIFHGSWFPCSPKFLRNSSRVFVLFLMVVISETPFSFCFLLTTNPATKSLLAHTLLKELYNLFFTDTLSPICLYGIVSILALSKWIVCENFIHKRMARVERNIKRCCSTSQLVTAGDGSITLEWWL